MIDTFNGQPDDAELSHPEALLPWYATGRLSADERVEVEGALASDPELRRRLALVRAEQSDTIALNESLGLPSAAVLDRLMAKIDIFEAQTPRRAAFGAALLGWLSRTLSDLSPRTLAWLAAAAAVVICVQAGLLTSVLVEKGAQPGQTDRFARHQGQPNGPGFTAPKLASAEPAFSTKGTYALISFAGSVSVQQMTDFLAKHHAFVVKGPKDGGFYSVEIADHKLTDEEAQSRLAELRAESGIVSMIVPLAQP